MLPHPYYPFGRPVSLFEHFMLDFFTKAPTTWETTSYDGKPFLTPTQFLDLSSQQDKRVPAQISNKTTPKSKKPLKKNSKQLNNKYDANILNDDESDVEIIEVIQKKVKTNTSAQIINQINDKQKAGGSSIICLSPSSIYNSNKTKKCHVETKSENSVMTNDSNASKRLKCIVKTIYEKGGELKFAVKCEQGSDKKEITIMMTREEIVSQAPMLLVYYYEKHLEFDQVKGFDPLSLEKA